MDDSYLDTHICLGCRQTIVGLDAYIQHKKFDCAILKSKELNRNNPEPLLEKDASDAHFNCDFTSAANPSLPPSSSATMSYGPLSSPWFDMVSNSVNNGQPETLSCSTNMPTVSCNAQPSADLDENIVFCTAEDCSFFNSLQLKSKTSGGQLQQEYKFKSLENLVIPECSADKNMLNMSPFLEPSKQLEHLCGLNSLKIEAEIFGCPDSADVLPGSQQKGVDHVQSELCSHSKTFGDGTPCCWKNGSGGGNVLFDPTRRSDGGVLPERKGDVVEGGYTFDHSKALQIACMFNNLELESDSDSFMPSDTDDLLNFSDMDDEHSFHQNQGEGKSVRERGTTGGKLESYKHMGKAEVYARSRGKLQRLRKEGGMQDEKLQRNRTRSGKQIATKWRPGERPMKYPPHASRGKWQGPEGEDIEEEDNTDEDETDTEDKDEDGKEEERKQTKHKGRTTPGIDVKGKSDEHDGKTNGNCSKPGRKTVVKPTCVACNKTFSSQASLDHHLTTTLHKNRSQRQTVGEDEEHGDQQKVKLSCALCDKVFHSKYSFARHLMTPFHARRAQYNEKHKLVAVTGLEAGILLLMERLQPFQCRICSFYTDSDEKLMSHLDTTEHVDHVEKLSGPFMCVRCQYTCRYNADMLQHVLSIEHQNAVKASFQPCVLKEKKCKITCSDCDLVIHSTAHLASHQKMCHSGVPVENGQSDATDVLKCSYCAATFTTKANLAVHVRRLHTKEKPFHCRTCKKAFADSGALKLHKQTKQHANAIKTCFVKKENVRTKLKVENDDGENKRMYKCRHCEFITDRYSEFIVHRSLQHTPPDCVICGLRFGNQLQYTKHMMSRQHRKKEEESKISSGNILMCDKCPRKFYNIRSLKMHEMNHQLASSRVAKGNCSAQDDIEIRCRKLIRESKLAGGKVECPECGKYLTKIGILPHLRAHAGIFPFQCTYCSKKFVDASIMRRHLKVHLGIRSYKCQFCSREFDRRLTLDTHLMREHKDSAGIVASHLCNICGHKFLQLNQLNAHLKFHDKTVRCPHAGCPLTFRYQSEMLIHMQVHTKETRFLCDECGYAGKTKTQLSRHRRVHTGERRYKCCHCSYVAAHIANLKRHERVHTGNKPYQCPHCKYSCNTQENLRKHILKTKRHAGKPVYPCPRCEFGCNSANEFQNHMEVVHSISRNHLPSIVAGLYHREADVRPFQDGARDQCSKWLDCAIPG